MIKRALLVGIDQYDCMPPLRGCVNDVNALFPLLARNEDNLRNFHCEVRTSAADRVDRHCLRQAPMLHSYITRATVRAATRMWRSPRKTEKALSLA